MLGMLGFGLFLENIELAKETRGPLIGLHKAIGAVFLFVAVWRVGYRVVRGFPNPARTMPVWQQNLAHAVHWVLLAGVVIMPVSGLITIPAFERNEVLAGIGYFAHAVGAKLLLAAIAVHVVGALKHHFIDKERTLGRMIAGGQAQAEGQHAETI